MKNYITYNGYTRTTFDEMNAELASIGAKITTKMKALQPTSEGYAAAPFRDAKKPVYDFQIVDNDGRRFANIHSYLYRSENGQTPKIIKKYAFGCYYVETTKAIYIG